MMNLNTIFIDFGSQNGAQKLGRSDLAASLNGCLEPSWPQVVTFSDFDLIFGSLGRLLGLSWDVFRLILAPLCNPLYALGVYVGPSLAVRRMLGSPWAKGLLLLILCPGSYPLVGVRRPLARSASSIRRTPCGCPGV